MATPRTPLLVAPGRAENQFGQTILSHDLITKLRKINPLLQVPTTNDGAHIKEYQGMTGLWLGAPHQKGSTYICGFKLGPIPEFTQVDEFGRMMLRGWRAIFEKALRTRAVTRLELETAFKVNLDETGVDVDLCAKCVREGKRVPANGGKLNMCDDHEMVYAQTAKARAKAPELEEKARWTKEKIYVS